jgi:hypothetical protein
MGVHNILTYRTVLLVELLHCGIYGRWPVSCGAVAVVGAIGYRRCRAYIAQQLVLEQTADY